MFSLSRVGPKNKCRAACTDTATKKIINLEVVGGITDKRLSRGKMFNFKMYRMTGDLGWERRDAYDGIHHNTQIIDYGDDDRKESELWYIERTNIRKITYFNSGNIHIDEWHAVTREENLSHLYKIIEYYKNGFKKLENWFDSYSKRHRVDGPAVLFFNVAGLIEAEEWYIHGIKI